MSRYNTNNRCQFASPAAARTRRAAPSTLFHAWHFDPDTSNLSPAKSRLHLSLCTFRSERALGIFPFCVFSEPRVGKRRLNANARLYRQILVAIALRGTSPSYVAFATTFCGVPSINYDHGEKML